ncbi:hypothetical protein [Stenotrophomonas sp. BIGb0135]|uniref:hypothetical protein n=1 Tax=Stenotrophomonas sp. BIGb0135 TaxID=2940620 RepID=UPI002167BD0F|nr:hypothetical protein [Stenotrophomonas sp. BIGb0135]MCS4234409.1 hypothetical protein [Stenotrophomonas sp. BIGb0135]
MAAITAAVVVGAGMAYSANRQGAAAKKAGRAQASAAQQTLDQQQALYNNAVEGAQPYADAGTNALSQLEAVNRGDYSGFENAPDYLYARDQGIQGLDRGAAARGGLYSGGADADRIAFSSGLASQNLGNYTNRLMGLTNLGSNTQQYLGQLGQSYGNQFANAMGIKGQANAQIAAAGPMTQAGYGNALASAASTYAGAAGGGGGMSSMFSGFGGGGGGQGSMTGFGNNMDNFLGGNARKSSWG